MPDAVIWFSRFDSPASRGDLGQGGRLGCIGTDDRHAVVHQDFLGATDVHHGGFAEVGDDRGGQQAFAQVLDGDVAGGNGAGQSGRARQLARP